MVAAAGSAPQCRGAALAAAVPQTSVCVAADDGRASPPAPLVAGCDKTH